MNQDIRSVPTQASAAPGTDTFATQGQSPFLLERLDIYLGRPAWFWPVVLTMLLVLIICASSCAPEMELYA